MQTQKPTQLNKNVNRILVKPQSSKNFIQHNINNVSQNGRISNHNAPKNSQPLQQKVKKQPNKSNYKDINFDPNNNFIVSMYELGNFIDSVIANIQKENRSTTLIFRDTPQKFFDNRKYGIVLNPKSFDIPYGITGCTSTFRKDYNIIDKIQRKLDTKNPSKPVLDISYRGNETTDYTRYDISNNTNKINRSNEEALNLYTRAIKYKYDKQLLNNPTNITAKTCELMVKPNGEKNPILGIIIDTRKLGTSGQSVSQKILDAKYLLDRNPNFNLYLYCKDGKINTIESKYVGQFFKDIKKKNDANEDYLSSVKYGNRDAEYNKNNDYNLKPDKNALQGKEEQSPSCGSFVKKLLNRIFHNNKVGMTF